MSHFLAYLLPSYVSKTQGGEGEGEGELVALHNHVEPNLKSARNTTFDLRHSFPLQSQKHV